MLDEHIDAIVINGIGEDIFRKAIGGNCPEMKKIEGCKSMSDVLRRLDEPPVKPLVKEEIGKIWARYEKASRKNQLIAPAYVKDDISILISEIGRLRAKTGE